MLLIMHFTLVQIQLTSKFFKDLEDPFRDCSQERFCPSYYTFDHTKSLSLNPTTTLFTKGGITPSILTINNKQQYKRNQKLQVWLIGVSIIIVLAIVIIVCLYLLS